MSYPAYFKSYAPEINLPYPKTVNPVIFDYYDISELDNTAKCKECGKVIFMIKGCHVTSSYTSGLTFHLPTHPVSFQEYLDKLKEKMVPDNKTKLEHFQARSNQHSFRTNKFDLDKRFDECRINACLIPRNSAGVKYLKRDIEIFRNKIDYMHQNKTILEYFHEYTNRNIPFFQLENKSKRFIENDGNIILDIERLLCPYVCFFDPEKFYNCRQKHQGDVTIFGDAEYQSQFEGFIDEIEKYPEFHKTKSFNAQILKESNWIENNKLELCEMNRLLKIIISLFLVYKPNIQLKLKNLFTSGITKNGLLKPELGIQLWGPWFKMFEVETDVDASSQIPESKFSTFRHVQNKDCPSYTDNSKKRNEKARFIGKRAFYPCNFASCLEDCVCIPCKNPDEYSEKDSFGCLYHKIDHPEMFNEKEDLLLPRRQYVKFNPDVALFERPGQNKFLCPPPIKLPKMKKNCKSCKEVFDDHQKNHHIIHEMCQICSHIDRLSKISFKLTCCICLKTFSDKYTLSRHMHLHDDQNSNFCDDCQKGFSTKYHYENHVQTIHSQNRREFMCKICEKPFSTKSNLKRHHETKHRERDQHSNFECKQCEKVFERSDNLIRHEKTEHNEQRNTVILPGVNEKVEPYPCYVCDKVYTTKFSALRHIEKSHTKQTFACEECWKTFSTNETLQAHIIQDHNIPRRKPKIICEICRDQFPGKNDLKQHRLQYHKDC